MKRVVCLWLPNWPIQRRVARRSALDREAFALWREHPRGRRIAHVSPAAARLGVQPEMLVADAAALLDQKLLLLPHEPRADRDLLAELARRCERFTPLVGIEQADSPESLLLDLTGIGSLLGGWSKAVESMAEQICQWRLAARIALAPSVAAAWAVAHFDDGTKKRPLLVTEETLHDVLCPLPIAALRLPPELIEMLSALGLESIGQLWQLPRDSLARRFDPQLLQRLDQLTGALPETIQPPRRPETFAAEWQLPFPASDGEAIEAALEQLARRLAGDLASRGRGALEVAYRIDCEDHAPVGGTVGLYRPCAEEKHLAELLHLARERLRLPSPATAIALEATRVAPLAPRQQSLFNHGPADDERQLALCLDRLTQRLGQNRVARPVLCAEADPQRASRHVPVLASARRSRRQRPRHGPLDRPLCLFGRPRLATTVSIVPDGPPVRFSFRGRQHVVAQAIGPERIETSWWHRQGIRRDYYRVETTDGQWFWLFRSLKDGKWYVHGEFS